MSQQSSSGTLMLDQLYRSMQRAENKVGGGEGVEGCYGTLTRAGVEGIMGALAARCGLGPGSVLVDIGAGIGRPLLHAMQHPGVSSAWGVEIDPVKCRKGRAYIDMVVRDLAGAGARGGGAAGGCGGGGGRSDCSLGGDTGAAGGCARGPSMVCVPVEALTTLQPATHVYACWEGMPRTAKLALGALFAAAATVDSIAVTQRAFRRCPLEEMAAMGFGPLRLLGTFPVHLAGSQRQLNAYIFVKAGGARAGTAGGRCGSTRGPRDAAAGGAGAEPGCGVQGTRARRGRAGAVVEGKRGGGAKRAAALPPVAAAGSGASSSDAHLEQWLRLNGICAEATSDATSKRVRRQRRLS